MTDEQKRELVTLREINNNVGLDVMGPKLTKWFERLLWRWLDAGRVVG